MTDRTATLNGIRWTLRECPGCHGSGFRAGSRVQCRQCSGNGYLRHCSDTMPSNMTRNGGPQR